jgi:hypothetical protein
MIDSNEYYRSYQLHKPEFTHDTLIGTDFTENPDLMDEHFLLCVDRVPAFSLTTKTWGFFEVNRIDDIEFNSTAFENLALEQDKKDMIAALVRSGQRQGDHLLTSRSFGRGQDLHSWSAFLYLLVSLCVTNPIRQRV